MADWGWCEQCRKRIGSRKFRQLYEDICAECHRFMGNELPQPKPKPESKPEPKPPKRPRKPYTFSQDNPNRLKRIAEEQQLLAAFAEFPQSEGDAWVKNLSVELGWEYNHTKAVGRRLRRKGHKLPTACELVYEYLAAAQKPICAYELSKSLKFSTAWIAESLKRLEQQGRVEVIRKYRNYYSVTEKK